MKYITLLFLLLINHSAQARDLHLSTYLLSSYSSPTIGFEAISFDDTGLGFGVGLLAPSSESEVLSVDYETNYIYLLSRYQFGKNYTGAYTSASLSYSSTRYEDTTMVTDNRGSISGPGIGVTAGYDLLLGPVLLGASLNLRHYFFNTDLRFGGGDTFSGKHTNLPYHESLFVGLIVGLLF